jgi:nucleotide-binding universal stress UspA family protein
MESAGLEMGVTPAGERRPPRIILATHGGRGAHGATRVASLLARRLGAELDAVGVLAPSPPMDSGFGLVFPPSTEVEAELASQIAGEIVGQFTHCGLPECHPRVRIGQPAAAIADAARSVNAALIVLGLGPHHAIDRALGGETTLQLVQIASTPVLAVPAAANALPQRALVAVDFTPTSLAVAQTAASVVADGAVVELVHVRTAARHEPSVPDAELRLRELATTIGSTRPLAIEVSVLSGAPGPTLLDTIRSRGADLIALGSHGYGLWKRLTIGSVASKVIRLAEVAVLVQPIGSIGVTSAR